MLRADSVLPLLRLLFGRRGLVLRYMGFIPWTPYNRPLCYLMLAFHTLECACKIHKPWQERGRPHSMDPSNELPKLLTICDAKSLYDHLHSETAGCTADHRTAIEMQIIRSSLDAQDGDGRWVDHSGMNADAITKKGGNAPSLQTRMRTGRICITEETASLF